MLKRYNRGYDRCNEIIARKCRARYCLVFYALKFNARWCRHRRRWSRGSVRRVKVSVPTAGYDLVRFPHPAQLCTRESSTNLQQNSYRHTRRLHYRKEVAITYMPAASATPHTIIHCLQTIIADYIKSRFPLCKIHLD